MTISASTKIRAIGGASVLALTAGMSMPVAAQMAPAPGMAAPTPTPPAIPVNLQECGIVADTVVCEPGTDGDGFVDATDAPLGLDIQDGAVVLNSVSISGTTTGVVDGAILTDGDLEGGLSVGDGSDVTVNGFIQTDGDTSFGVTTGADSNLTNNGTIYTTGDTFSDAVVLGGGSTFTNNGLVQTEGVSSFGVFGAADDITIINSVDGSIITSGDGSFGIAALNGAIIDNAGLIQTFGDFAIGIDVQNGAVVTNSGNIVTSGESSFAVSLRADGTFTNTETGFISTSGDEATAVVVEENGVIVNDGIIQTSGDGAIAISAGANADVTNNGTVSTSGDNLADAIVVGVGSTVLNNGAVTTSGISSFAIFGEDGVTLTNSDTGLISTSGDGSFAVSLGNDSTLSNEGVISTNGNFAFAVELLDGATITNNGVITTVGNSSAGISVGSDSVIESNGSILTGGTDSIAIIAEDGALITLGADSVISTLGDNAGGIVILGNGDVTNGGILMTEGLGAQGVTIVGDGTVNNTGSITVLDGRAVQIGGAGSVFNGEGAEISTANGTAIEIAFEGGVVGNAGTISAVGDGNSAILLLDSSIVTNSGSITSMGDNFADTVVVGSQSTIENSGLISSDGDSSFAIFGDGDEIEVTNTETGEIRTSGDGSFAVALGSLSSVQNDGLIATTGDFAFAVDLLDEAIVINNGTITTAGNSSAGISVGEGSTVTNDGSIATEGDNGIAIIAGDGSTVTLGMGSAITTEGVNAGGVVVLGDGTVTNAGTINTALADAQGISIVGDGTVENTGTINTLGARAIDVGGLATITNGLGAFVGSSGDDVIRVLGDGSSITNDGTILAEGGNNGGRAIDARGVDGLTITNTGLIGSNADDAIDVSDGNAFTLTNDGTIRSTGGRAIDARDVDGTVIVNNGMIRSGEADAIDVSGGDTISITNTGMIFAVATDTKAIDGGDNLTVINSGVIRASNGEGKGVEGDENLTVINMEGGLIEALGEGAEAVEADGAGLVLVNNGTIRSEFDDAVDGDDNVDITNTGLIEGNANDALELNSGTIDNSGTIISLSSDPNGSLVAPGGDPELDAAIDFDAGTDGNENGLVINRVGGLIEGDIGIVASPGNVDSPDTNDGSQVVYNYGTITGRVGGAALLGNGDDIFGTLNSAVENGIVDGGDGFDFLGVVANDEIGKTFDLSALGTQYINFELVQFGQFNFDPFGFVEGTTAGTGALVLTGETDILLQIFNGATLSGSTTGGVTLIELALNDDTPLAQPLAFNITETGSVSNDAGNAITILADGYTINNAGSITATDGRAIEGGDFDDITIINSGTIEASDRAINLGDGATITNEMGGLINTTGDADTIQTGDDLTLVNNGTISNEGFDTKIIDAGDNLTVVNNGTITSDWKGVEGEANFTLTNNAGALIFSTNDEAVEADDAGLVVVNDGEIIAPKDDAVDGGADVTITNTGLIRGGENDAIELDSGTITNSGIIESLSSDPEGDFSDAALTNRELDAGIDFDGVDDPDNLAGPETDTVTNLAGGIIRGDIGINASSGNFVSDGMGGSVAGSPANVRSQTIINFGEITANLVNPVSGRLDAVLLSGGDDAFQQWTGAVVNGWIDLEGGDDTFILEGTASSVTGGISGGMGTDLAIIAGTLDADNFVMFENFQIGSTLGGTLNDAVISGNRTLDGDVSVVGEVTLGLGVDRLTATGAITLEDGSTVTITTPLDNALAGQTVLVLDDGTGFTDNGATINIIDDDFLLDYTPIIGSLSVAVNAVNPVVNSVDPNVATFGGALQNAITAGTLSQANFDLLNALPNAAALEDFILDALPSLSGGAAREIFETSAVASQALNRHIAAEGSGVWGQIIMRGADQDSLSLTAGGYESEATIFTIGGDIALGEAGRVGLLFSYADIENDDISRGVEFGETEIESMKIGAYAAFGFAEHGFVNGEISFLNGEVEDERSGALGLIGSEFDFDGWAYSAIIGYDVVGGDDFSVVPSIGITGASIDFDSAAETGGFGFIIDREDADFTELRGGLELSNEFSDSFSAFFSGTFVHDLSGDGRTFTFSSTQLGTFSLAVPGVEEDRYELAAGATITASDKVSIDFGYIGEFNDGYDAHAGRASVRIAF